MSSWHIPAHKGSLEGLAGRCPPVVLLPWEAASLPSPQRVTCTNCDRISATSWKVGRCRGWYAKQRFSSCASTGGRPSGVARVWCCTPTMQTMWAWWSPAHALLDVSISHSSTPKLYTSAACTISTKLHQSKFRCSKTTPQRFIEPWVQAVWCQALTQQVTGSSLSGNVLIFQACVGYRKKVFGLGKRLWHSPCQRTPLGCTSVSTGSIGARTRTQTHLVGTLPTISWKPVNCRH